MNFKKVFQHVLFILILGASLNAQAMTLQQAMEQLGNYKEQGFVGEKTNGFLGVVIPQKGAQEVVQLINQARLEQYRKMAAENNLSIQEIEDLAGQKSIQKTRSGHYIEANGQWIKK